jgi:hypothetical protein
MSDTFTTKDPRPLLVDGRNPFPDEIVSVNDASVLSIGDIDPVTGVVLVTPLVDSGSATITVDPGSEDPNRTSGSDDVTVDITVVATPLVVSLGDAGATPATAPVAAPDAPVDNNLQ